MSRLDTTDARHVDRLARDLGVTVHHDVTQVGNSYSYGAGRAIHTPRVTTELGYFVALHELGHQAHGHQGGSLGKLKREGEAWLWAFEHANREPSPAVARQCLKWLRSYERRWDEPPAEYDAARDYLAAHAAAPPPRPKYEQLALAV